MIAPNYVHFRYLFAKLAATAAADGFLEWPVADATQVVSTAITTYATAFPISIDLTITDEDPSGADDAVAWTDEWHWYLAQSTEGSGSERFELQRYDPSTTVSRSGRVYLATTASGAAELSVHSASVLDRMVRDMWIYAKNIANKTIYVLDVHRAMFANKSLTLP